MSPGEHEPRRVGGQDWAVHGAEVQDAWRSGGMMMRSQHGIMVQSQSVQPQGAHTANCVHSTQCTYRPVDKVAVSAS